MARFELFGTLQRMAGTLLEAEGIEAAVGDWCWALLGGERLPLEVVGFSGSRCLLMPLSAAQGLEQGILVSMGTRPTSPDPSTLLGRVINAVGLPLDGGPALPQGSHGPPPRPINPLVRSIITEPFDVGVRSINGLLTLGVGQRVGLFAGSGVGKSVLLGMLARYSAADVVVIGLIGERGREVQEFLSDNLGNSLEHSVVIASPADDAPGLRLRAAVMAHEVAEYYRAQGLKVLLLLDSVTRIAQAQREIGLAAGEPPTSKGYPPSVYSLLPRLIERAGGLASSGGSITAIYTVLMEEDDLSDPIVDAARAVLDGHIVLSRRIADRGQYPAIDIGASISRVQNKLQSPQQRSASLAFRRWWTRYREQEDLIAVGAYEKGSDPDTDAGIARHDEMFSYLCQDVEERVDLSSAEAELARVTRPLNAEMTVATIASNAT
ncbi:MAG: FliI/YscN family ATPase [Pseudomonadales bacterium]